MLDEAGWGGAEGQHGAEDTPGFTADSWGMQVLLHCGWLSPVRLGEL